MSPSNFAGRKVNTVDYLRWVADPEDIARFWSALAITECDRRANRRHGRGGCIPRIVKVVNPVDIARVGAGVHASRCGQAGLPTIAD
jgi:hypothetical protein